MGKMDIVEKHDKVEESPPLETLEVSIDTPFEKVIESDKKGWKVTFDEAPGRFKRLNDEEFHQLHRHTQAAYALSERYHQSALDAASNPRAVLQDIRQDARATDRLHVGNKRPDQAYSWKRDDEITHAVGYEGWKVETDPKLETFRKPAGGAYAVGTLGKEELILVSRPKALHDAHLREAVKASNRLRGVPDAPERDPNGYQVDTYSEQVAAGNPLLFAEGNPTVDPKNRKWRDVDPSQD